MTEPKTREAELDAKERASYEEYLADPDADRPNGSAVTRDEPLADQAQLDALRERLNDSAARARAEIREREDRETDAKHRVEHFQFWHNDDQQERGPLDRPGVIERAHAPHRMQGQTRDRAHVWVNDRAIRVGRGRGEERQR